MWPLHLGATLATITRSDYTVLEGTGDHQAQQASGGMRHQVLHRTFSDPTRLMDIKQGVLRGLSLSSPPETESPAYEIVGEVERFDQRDIPFSRLLLNPTSPHYDEYYSRRPELKRLDDGWRDRSARSAVKAVEQGWVNAQLEACGFFGSIVLSRMDVVEADVRLPTRPQDRIETGPVQASPDQMAWKIKALALQLGAARARIGRLNQSWVYSHWGVPFYGEPVMLDYENIVCMAIPQDPFLIDVGSGTAQSFEVGWKYSLAALVSGTVADFIRRLGWRARPLPVHNAPYLVPPTFVDCGIGEFGRCGFVVTKELGNNWRPAAVATDLPLATDKPVDFGLQDFCEKCKICARACPARAISAGEKVAVRGVRRWDVDGDRCFAYWQTTGKTCAICQAVCPWNHPNNHFHNWVREMAQRWRWLRPALIRGEELAYRALGRGPEPEWVKLPPA